jgi:hypothetical protein
MKKAPRGKTRASRKKAVLKIILLVAVLAVLAAGGWLYRAHRTPHYLFLDGVSAEHARFVRRVSVATVAFMQREHRRHLVYPLRVIVVPTEKHDEEIYALWDRGIGYRDDDVLGWLRLRFKRLIYRHNVVILANAKTSDRTIAHTTAHEIIHSYFFGVGHRLDGGWPGINRNIARTKELRWLLEGECDVLAGDALASMGYAEEQFDAFRDETVRELARVPAAERAARIPSIKLLSSAYWDGVKDPDIHARLYVIARLAVMRMVERMGNPATARAAFWKYHEQIRDGASVDDAFQAAFGFARETFESDFDREMSRLP